jgi:precorrin-3B synthase
MTSAAYQVDPYIVRGWCPTGIRPMQTGDGLLVRLSPRGRSLDVSDLATIVDAAERHGNGLIDLTRRANLQLRGVTESSLPRILQDLAPTGLLAMPAANILIGPLAGIDRRDLVDTAALGAELEAAIAADPALHALPAKFSFVVDGGGDLPLDAEAADVRLRAMIVDGTVAIALAIARPDGDLYLGASQPRAAVFHAVEVAGQFLKHRAHPRARMRDLPEASARQLLPAHGVDFIPLPRQPEPSQPHRPLGIISVDGQPVAVGLAAAFGRLSSADLRNLASRAADLGISSFRVSPWRALYALTSNIDAARTLAAWATTAGFITSADDPLLAFDVCPGAPACSSASVDTRAAARALAPLLMNLGFNSCHISGCSKGCARSSPADLTLVGAGGSLAVVHHGTARSTPTRFVRLGDIAARPHQLTPV